MMTDIVNISRVVDEQKLGWFNIRVIALGWFAIVADGYDTTSAAFAAPALIKEWHVTKQAMGPVFSASLIGFFFGALSFGWISDRIGRKRAMILACLINGVTSLACMAATNVDELFWLRFLTGIGLGGIVPGIISMTAEYAPQRMRATMVIVMNTGVNIGTAAPGWVSAAFIAQYGWRAIYFVGGILPLLSTLLLILFLPESIKFLTLQKGREKEVARLATIIHRAPVSPASRFILDDAAAKVSFRPQMLFSQGLAFITPLIWVLFIVNFLTNYFLQNWMPIVFEGDGLSPAHAAMVTSMYSLGGVLGGIAVSRLIDRFGMVALSFWMVVTCVAVASVGVPGLPYPALLTIASSAGFGVLGAQFAINASPGLIYPTHFRGNGVAWAFAVSRVGAVIGAMLGGILLSWGMSTPTLFYVPVLPLLIGAAAAGMVAKLLYTRFGGFGMRMRPKTAAGE